MKINKIFAKLSSYFNIHIYFMFVIIAFIIDHIANIIVGATYYFNESITIIIFTSIALLANFKLYLVLVTNRVKNVEIIKKLDSGDYNDINNNTEIEELYRNFSLEIKLVWGSLLIFLAVTLIYIIYILRLAAIGI